MPPITLFILCRKRQLQAIVDEYEDWQGEGVTIKLYGVTKKTHDGFIVLEWQRPLTERFETNLKADEDIIDYLVFDATSPHVLPI